MPLYEYYCEHCDGVFETLRAMREASEPASCPLCDRDARRIMPTSFAAFTFRDGLPRRIPDDFKYWHWDGRKTKEMNKGGVPGNEHSELYKPEPRPRPTRGDLEEMAEVHHLKGRHLKMMRESGLDPAIGPDGQPALSPKLGASGHVD
ncbi:MAG TPA: zinc ribbon domain-containing protein [Dehalococcoidia bacterium]